MTQLPNLRRLTISFNQIPVDQSQIKDLFRETEASEFTSMPAIRKDTVLHHHLSCASLIGHPKSNQILADYLRGHGYARLIDLLLNTSINQDDLNTACSAWEKP